MRRVAVGVLLLVLLIAGALGARAYEDWQTLQRPTAVRMQDTSRIRSWMTVGFIARAHGVPPQALAQKLGAPAPNVTLDQLAQQRGVPPSVEEGQARQAIVELRAGGSS